MLLLDSQAIVVTDGVKRRCVSRAALPAGDENEEVNQGDEMHDRFVYDSTTPGPRWVPQIVTGLFRKS